MTWTASQIIAVMIDRLGGEPQVFKLDDLRKFKSALPCVFTLDDDQQTVTVEVLDDERLPGEMQ